MATHSSIFAWRIPWTEEPGRLQSMRSQGSHVSHTHTHTHTHTHVANELFAFKALSQNLRIGKPNLRQLRLLRVERRKFMWAVMNPHINSFFRSALSSRLVTAIMSPS